MSVRDGQDIYQFSDGWSFVKFVKIVKNDRRSGII